jgi:WD40 repeat protein
LAILMSVCALFGIIPAIELGTQHVHLSVVLRSPVEHVSGLAFSADGKILASSDFGRTIQIWDVSKGALKTSIDTSNRHVRSLGFTIKGDSLIFAGGDILTGGATPGNGPEYLRIWDLAKKEAIAKTHVADNVVCMQLDPRGDVCALGCLDGVVRRWDISRGIWLETLRGHSDSICAIAYKSDGQSLATASSDGTVKVWDLGSRQVNSSFSIRRNGFPYSLLFADNDSRLICGLGRDGVKSWRPLELRPLGKLNEVLSNVLCLALSPHGSVCAIGGSKRVQPTNPLDNPSDGVPVLLLWDLKTDCELGRFYGHTDQITCVAFSPKGDLVATGGWDARIRILNVEKLLKARANKD